MSSLFFKWLTGKEKTLGLNDFEIIEPQMYNSLRLLSKLKLDEFKDMDLVSFFLLLINFFFSILQIPGKTRLN